MAREPSMDGARTISELFLNPQLANYQQPAGKRVRIRGMKARWYTPGESPLVGVLVGIQPPTRPAMRFGPFEIDPENSELRREGVRVRVQKLPLQLLAVLLERPGHLVTRQELQKRLWPADTFVDFEDGLNTAIKKLREALGDEKENPLFIETIPRQGYRFVAKVETRNGTGISIAEASGQALSLGGVESSRDWEGEKPRGRGWRFTWRARALVGAAFASAAFTLWWFNPLPPPSITHTDQVTVSARIDTPVRAISDAQHIFYIERDGGHWNLMRTSLGGGDGQRVTVPANNGMALDVSPDNSKILIGTFGKRGEENQVWTMPVQGGAATRLGDMTAGYAAYSPDGNNIAYTHGTSLWIMESDGSHPRKLADITGAPGWLAWAPDGQSLRFTISLLSNNAVTSIWQISRNGTSLHQVLADWLPPASKCCGTWTPDGRYFIFEASLGGAAWNVWALRESGSLWRRSPQGPFQLTSGPHSVLTGMPGLNGTSLLFYNGSWREEVQRLDLKTHKFSPLLPNAHATLNSFSRDGAWKAYIDRQTGSLFRSRADGTEQVVLATGEIYHPSFPRWSPDGKWIVFGGGLSGQPASSFVVPASGGHPEPFLQGEGEVGDADWSADGKKIVLSHALGPDDSAGRELQIVDFETRRAEKLPGSDNLAVSRWSPDGRYISAVVYDQSELRLWDFSSKKWNVVARGTALGISVWSPDSHYFYFQDLLSPGQSLYRYDIQRKRSEVVAEFSEILKAGAADRCALEGITPDGSPIIDFNRGAYDLFASTLRLP